MKSITVDITVDQVALERHIREALQQGIESKLWGAITEGLVAHSVAEVREGTVIEGVCRHVDEGHFQDSGGTLLIGLVHSQRADDGRAPGAIEQTDGVVK